MPTAAGGTPCGSTFHFPQKLRSRKASGGWGGPSRSICLRQQERNNGNGKRVTGSNKGKYVVSPFLLPASVSVGSPTPSPHPARCDHLPPRSRYLPPCP